LGAITSVFVTVAYTSQPAPVCFQKSLGRYWLFLHGCRDCKWSVDGRCGSIVSTFRHFRSSA